MSLHTAHGTAPSAPACTSMPPPERMRGWAEAEFAEIALRLSLERRDSERAR